MASMTPPKSNAGTPQRPVESEDKDISLSLPTRTAQIDHSKEKKRNDEGSSTETEDEGGYTESEKKQLEDDLLSPASSPGSDVGKAAMEKELEEQGLIRKSEDAPLKRSKPSERNVLGTPGKVKSKGIKKDQSLPESEIVNRWNREFGDVCVVASKA